MKKTAFTVALLITAALAGCHHKKDTAAPGGGSGSDMGSGSAAGSAAGSGEGSAPAPAAGM